MTEAARDPRSPAGPRGGSRPLPVLRLGIFGAALDTGNLGVSALGISTLCGLAAARENLDLTLFDYGEGERPVELAAPAGPIRVRQLGVFDSRRLWRTGNLRSMWWCARLGLRALHPMLRRFASLHALLDISGGDSFSDLYGAERFRAVALPKRLALELGVPLVLLPQTYGPYAQPRHREIARELLLGARQAWARDRRSLHAMREVLGDAFEPARHRAGVDVAFGLPAVQPRGEIPARLRELRARGGPLLGLNASGLLWHDALSSAHYGLRADYRTLVRELFAKLLATPCASLVLVPHVVPPCAPEESDVAAAQALLAGLPAADAERVWLAPALSDPREIKWLIGQLDWLCATRMHACIAALSQGVPALGLAYSDKALGVFESVGAGAWLVDPRRCDPGAVVPRALESVARRDAVAQALRAELPSARQRVAEQFQAIVDAIA